MGTEGHPTSGLIAAFCEGYRIGDDLYIAGQEESAIAGRKYPGGKILPCV